jgi:hypothetical protein
LLELQHQPDAEWNDKQSCGQEATSELAGQLPIRQHPHDILISARCDKTDREDE